MIIEIYSRSSEQQKLFCVCVWRAKKEQIGIHGKSLVFFLVFFLLFLLLPFELFYFRISFRGYVCVRVCAWFDFAFIFLLYSSETLYLIVSRYIDISLNGIYFIRRSIEIKLKDNNDTINNMWEKSLVTFHFGRKSENKKKTKKRKTNLVKTTNQHRQEINSELQNLPRLFDVQVYQSKV